MPHVEQMAALSTEQYNCDQYGNTVKRLGPNKLAERKFSLLRSFIACFVAVEAGALVVCIGIMILDSGLLASFEGIAVWVIAQPIVFVVAICSMPVGALLRMILGLAFDQPRSVALITGALVGLVGAIAIAFTANDGWHRWPLTLSLGFVAGVVGGWAWWRVEKPYLDSPADTASN